MVKEVGHAVIREEDEEVDWRCLFGSTRFVPLDGGKGATILSFFWCELVMPTTARSAGLWLLVDASPLFLPWCCIDMDMLLGALRNCKDGDGFAKEAGDDFLEVGDATMELRSRFFGGGGIFECCGGADGLEVGGRCP
ncbi:hypothetical protein ACLB2K_054742 [Fragaria x ananassa]